MSYAFRWLTAHICYFLGDLISHLPGGWWYPVCNWLFVKSSELDYNDLGIWDTTEDDDASNKEH